MAKKDFCFTYYDGDAARDMAHMNRLERGSYSDIIISQRKFGPLTLNQIKKILGRDFDECFDAIELVLLKNSEGKYYIEWLFNSINDSIKHSGYQSENGKKGGRPPKNKPKQKPIQTQTEANSNPNNENKKPLGDEDESVDEDIDENKNGIDNFSFHVDTQLPDVSLEAIERNQFTHTKNKNTDYVLSQWKVFLSERLADPPERRCSFHRIEDLTSYFINWMRNKFPPTDRKVTGRNAGAFQLLDSLRDDFKPSTLQHNAAAAEQAHEMINKKYGNEA